MYSFLACNKKSNSCFLVFKACTHKKIMLFFEFFQFLQFATTKINQSMFFENFSSWKNKMNVVISKGVFHPFDLQNLIFLGPLMIMTWYLGWDDFRAWKTFSEFLVNRCWLNFDIGCLICKNPLKNAKKDNCWLKTRGCL